LRRAGAGTALVDPIPLRSDLSALVPALTGPEWVLHAANQDLPCLAEVGLAPAQLFDTELAGRLLGLPRVGLGPMVEQLLGLALEKGHGAADWSRRPLPEDWLVYAALDVEVLITLRDVLAGLLDEQGKLEWARQEFEAVRTAPTPAPRAEPWRRTSGVHRVRKPRALAAVRSLWEARDRLAAERDIAPGRVLPDAAIVDAATAAPATARRSPRCPSSAGGRSGGSPLIGSRRSPRPPVSTPPSSPAPPRRATAHRPSPAGPTATRPRPRASPRHGQPWRR
jgi:ribonuclease D